MTLQTLSNWLEATLKSLRTLRSQINDTKNFSVVYPYCILLREKKMQLDEVYIQVKVTPLSHLC